LLGGSCPGPGPPGRLQPGPKAGNPEPLLTLVEIIDGSPIESGDIKHSAKVGLQIQEH
jgi:hypothetical protein